MRKNNKFKLNDISKNPDKTLANVTAKDLMPLPFPTPEKEPIGPLKDEWADNYEHSFDDVIAVAIPKPKSKAEEEELVSKFKSGLQKLFTEENNWTFLQPLTLSMENCVKCQTCSEACPIYVASGRNEIYRPTYRSEILRRLYNKYVKGGDGLLSKIKGDDIELNWTTIARLAESAYRCILCRRCIRACADIAKKDIYSMAYRGFQSKVVVDYDVPLNKEECRDCGICIDYCPTTALLKPGKGVA